MSRTSRAYEKDRFDVCPFFYENENLDLQRHTTDTSHHVPKEIHLDNNQPSQSPQPRPACPVCGSRLEEIRGKLQCSHCHTICETCCEGGRG